MLSWLHGLRERSAVRPRDIVASAFAALTPFVVLAAFTWTKDGRPLGFVVLLGGGDLLPSTAVLCAHSVSVVVRRRVLSPVRLALLGGNWIVFAAACVVFAVPHTAPTGYQERVAIASAVTFTLALLLAAAEQVVASRERPGGPLDTAGLGRHPPHRAERA